MSDPEELDEDVEEFLRFMSELTGMSREECAELMAELCDEDESN